MAGAQTSMALQDRMSGPLMKIMRAMDSTIRVMEKMDHAASNIDTKGLAKARSSIQSASADMERLMSVSNSAGQMAAATTAKLSRMGGESGLAATTNAAHQATYAIEGLNRASMSTAASAGLKQSSAAAKSTADTFYTFGRAADKASTAANKLSGANAVLASDAASSSTWMTRLHDRFTQLPQPIVQSISAIERFHASLKNQAGNQLDRIRNQFTGLPGPINSAESAVRNFVSSFAGIAAAYLSIQGITNGFKKFVQASDTYTSTSARLSLINDGLQTQAELQDKIYNAAQRSLTPYNDMAGTIAKLNLLAGDAFKGNDETIRFSELMGKSFAVSGASTGEQQAGMHQLTQALASGRLQGDEFRSITENAPLLARAIADSVGASMGELKKMSSEGKITGDIIKNALFSAADDIESKFSKMPITFGDAMTLMKNWATAAFEPLLVRFNDFVNSDAFGVLAGHVTWFVNVFVAGMTLMFDIMEKVYTEIEAIGNIISDSWAVVGPVIVGVGTGLAAITLILMAKYAWLGLIRTATLAWAAAQWVVNAAYLANPIVLALVAIVVVIALIIATMVTWADRAAEVFGAIVGGIYWLGAAFTNVMMGIANLCIIVAEWFVNTWNQAVFMVQLAWIGLNLMVRIVLDAIGNAALKTAEWFMNMWNDAVFGVQTAFHKMASFVLTIMSGVASGVVGTVNAALGAISNLINGAVSGINSFIGLLNGVLGTDLSTVGTVDLKMSKGASNLFDNMQSNLSAPVRAEKSSLGRMDTAGDYMSSVTMPTAPQKANLGRMDTAGDYAKNIEMPSAPAKKSFDRMEYTSTSDAYDRGNAAGKALSLKASDKLSGAIEKVTGVFKNQGGKENPLVPGNIPTGDLTGMGNPLGGGADKLAKAKNPTGGKLDSIGKIDKDINIADEDLKMLRDAAEIKSIQNFVTLTPSVTFGDTMVREVADIDKIMKKIEKYFEGEMKNSVDGVYT